MSILLDNYLPDDAGDRLRRYEYHGDDRSYLYKHMWRPLCRWVVEKLPVWLAPNVITVTALFFVCVTHGILALYMPKLTVKNFASEDIMFNVPAAPFSNNKNNTATISSGNNGSTAAKAASLPFAKEFLPPPPPFVFVLAAVALFLYQLLDNLDGHQARRTGTSSPLGLLMDHGCDAFNCVVGSLSVAAALSAGPCWKSWFVVLSTVIVFFMNTWEEYYRGVLVLPVINGPNEGILLAIVVYLWTAYVGGPQWWYDNAVDVPMRYLPEVLRQPAPMAAIAVEKGILDRVCPTLTYFSGEADQRIGFSAVPFFFNLNCSLAYRESPPLPTRVRFDGNNPARATYEQMVVGKQWSGHGVIQKTVLRAYGFSEDTLRVRYNTIAVLFVMISAALTCAGNIYQVYRALYRMPHQERLDKFGRRSWLLAHFPFTHALTRLAPLLVLTVMANVWFFTSQEDVYRRHPRIFSWTVGLLFTKLAIHLMIAHLCGIEFNPFRRTFLPFLLFGGHIAMTYLHNLHRARRQRTPLREPVPAYLNADGAFSPGLEWASNAYSYYAYDLDEELILYEFFALSVCTFAHLVWHVVRQTAAVLDVPIFTVPAEKQRALADKIGEEKKQRSSAETAKRKKTN